MELNGWQIPIESLPGKLEFRTVDPKSGAELYLGDYEPRLYESPDQAFAAVLYSIYEYRMGTSIGRLAVFRRGEADPILTACDLWWYAPLQPAPIRWLTDRIFVAWTSAPREMPMVVFDLDQQRYGIIHVPRGDLYDISMTDGRLRLHPVDASNSTLEKQSRGIEELSWYALSRISEYDAAYKESAKQHGISTKPFRGPWYEYVIHAPLYALFAIPFWILRKLRIL